MGYTLYQKLEKMLEGMSGQTVTLDNLRSLIMRNVGADERTISQALQVMATTGLIKDVGNCRFEIL